MENNVIDCLGKEIGTFLIFERAGVDKRGWQREWWVVRL